MKRHSQFYVYMVQCADGSYYTGSTHDLKERIKSHNNGTGAKYLLRKLPVRLVYAKEYKYYKNALHAERSLKKMTQARKENLVQIAARNLSAGAAELRFANTISPEIA